MRPESLGLGDEAEGEGNVSAGTNGDMPIGMRGSARFVRIDDDEARAIAPGLLDHGPKMNVVAVDVCAPGEDELCKPEVLGWSAQLFAVHGVPGNAASLGTDGAVQAACAETMKEAAVHGAVAELADGAGIAVRQDGLRPVTIAGFFQARCDRVERFVPAHAFKGFMFAAAHQRLPSYARLTAQRIENAVWSVDAVKILGDFAAQKPLRDGL